ncbi:MAG TPA: DUF192 domain-containing protein [Pseudoneobacillus sp.]|nr:DUF192 domain-containing protein [Pseudoneobacillus sp.]
MKAVNLSNGAEIANEITKAHSFFKRLKGLMFSKSLPEGHGLHIQPCRSIHTFFMNYPIDILYLNKEFEIVGLQESFEPSKMGQVYKKGHSVLELPAGTLQKSGTKVGHKIKIN